MKINILTDDDVRTIDMKFAVDCMEEAFRQHASGDLIAPGRLVSDVEAGQLVFTVCASKTDQPKLGFRFYDLNQLHSPTRSELTAVFDATDGHLRALVVGPLLGAVRTGAIGGVAIDQLSNKAAKSLGVIGAGFQASTQIQAALSVREFEVIKVFSRNIERRDAFVSRMSEQSSCPIQSAGSAKSAVEDADVVICASTSSTPVLEADWLKPNVHINAVGPKFKNRTELDISIYERSQQNLVTDAPAQIAAFADTFLLHGSPLADRIIPLSSIVASQSSDQPVGDGMSIFISTGLAGTEVLLADAICDLMAE